MNNDEELLAAASLCMDLFRTQMCVPLRVPLRLTDDSSSCHCLDLALSHVCELTSRGLSVGYHLSVLKQHISGIARVSLLLYICNVTECELVFVVNVIHLLFL